MIERALPIIPLMLGAAAEAALPDPNSAGAIGWLSLTALAVLTGVKLVMDLWKEHFREVPRPADTYVAKTDFKDTVAEFTDRLERAVEKIEKFSSDNYEARRRMHKKINGQQNALNYLAGTLSRDGRSHEAKHIQALIKEEDHGDED